METTRKLKKTKKVTQLPKCNFCGTDAIWDVPTTLGTWANLCDSCAKEHTTLSQRATGTRFELRGPVSVTDEPKILMGEEQDTPDYWEYVMINSLREITCPHCDTENNVEVDASYVYDCCCGNRVQVPEGLL